MENITFLHLIYIKKLFKIHSIILLWLFQALFSYAPRYIEHR